VQSIHLLAFRIFATVAYLEADINEFFADAAEEGATDGIANDPVVLARIRAAWGLENRSPVLDKYDLTLALCDQPTFDKGAAPYQAVALLIRLRSALIHFKPDWQPGGGWPGEGDELSKLSKSLMKSFPENALAKEFSLTSFSAALATALPNGPLPQASRL
jgi:hypothetical protein